MYSFKITHGKGEFINVSVEPVKSKYKLTVYLEGNRESRVVFEKGDAHYTLDRGEASVKFTKKVWFTWDVSTGAVYDSRRIELDMEKGEFTYFTWGAAPPPKRYGYTQLFSHDLTADPSPSYKVYKYRGELRAKLE